MPFARSLALVVLFVLPVVAEEAPRPGSLEARLLAEGIGALGKAAVSAGDPRRGAVVFHQPTLACGNCHPTNGRTASGNSLGPDLTTWREVPAVGHLVESLLRPSQKIRKGFETAIVVRDDGRVLTGRLIQETDAKIILGLPQAAGGRFGQRVEIPRAEIDEWRKSDESIMPQGVVNQLGTRQQFLDLVAYVHAIATGGPKIAAELQPPAALLTARPLPEYESHIDHAALIRGFDSEGFSRGREIYERLCANCHGTHDRPGTLPTSRKFGREPLKNGHDPYSIYQTLTHGFGQMVPQHWMVPRQKYDVVHYLREDYLKRLLPQQYFRITDEYLGSLPAGDTLGPEPSNIREWEAMDYGHSLVHTYEFGTDGTNIAYKGIAVRLDGGPGGISRGRAWAVFEHDTLRLAGFWTGEGFIDWNGIQFNGKHNIHPRVAGTVHVQNRGPGWADPATGSFEDTQRVVGRDGRRYGPLPHSWGRYEGLYHFGSQAVIAYRVGDAHVLETPSLVEIGGDKQKSPVMVRSFEVGPRTRPMKLAVATRAEAELAQADQYVTFGTAVEESSEEPPAEPAAAKVRFDGATWFETPDGGGLDTSADFTVTARIRTRHGGTIFARTTPGPKWVPGGQVLFVRGGRLCYDIGWVGVLQSKERVADGRWHDVALTVQDGLATLFIDGKPSGSRELALQKQLSSPVVRIGYCAPNFPRPTFFKGEILNVRFWGTALQEQDFDRLRNGPAQESDRLLAGWALDRTDEDGVARNGQGRRFAAIRKHGPAAATARPEAAGRLIAGATAGKGLTWEQAGERLVLVVPPGEETLRFNVWVAAVEGDRMARRIAADERLPGPDRDLAAMTNGGPPRWPQPLVTRQVIGADDGPFAVDVLTRPAENPWLARVRPTGFDFLADGNRAAVAGWDGDVWLVSELKDPSGTLKWQRIASGLFQPLGVKVVDDVIHVTCRDQLVILQDLNGDGETDFYRCFNSDHQVTEHFHEFAMGLQRDGQGNWYYGKSARHALPAIVPHHGTLLRISPDGSRTEILATGFRAANGVCLNPDGTFFVTDQEGHWTPKNRINHVREGGFYGNMLGYHDVTDPVDDAMQPPLCWITNAFDRSPAELLWVDSREWGPLSGRLLNLSYGYGRIYVVPHEQVGTTTAPLMQGGMSPLPLPAMPTGLIRGRFHPQDGQLYTAGMFAWAGSQQQPGGFYRIRYTGKPMHLPVEFHARKGELELGFTGALDPRTATDSNSYTIRVWGLERTARYGSKHIHERTLKVESVRLTPDRSGVVLKVPDLAPTRGLSIRWDITSPAGEAVTGELHGTIHEIP
ncbi:MAG: c-type cytochrome [Planctomycetaceae bacterium]|nr:c-type cytochrome [Planctomycetaceae bacterium]